MKISNINKCSFLSECKFLVSIAVQVISCSLEDCIILIFISVPLSDKNIPYMDKTSTRYIHF